MLSHFSSKEPVQGHGTARKHTLYRGAQQIPVSGSLGELSSASVLTSFELIYEFYQGNLMTTRVQRLGVAGLVTNGRIRDIGIIREMGLVSKVNLTDASGLTFYSKASQCSQPESPSLAHKNTSDHPR